MKKMYYRVMLCLAILLLNGQHVLAETIEENNTHIRDSVLSENVSRAGVSWATEETVEQTAEELRVDDEIGIEEQLNKNELFPSIPQHQHDYEKSLDEYGLNSEELWGILIEGNGIEDRPTMFGGGEYEESFRNWINSLEDSVVDIDEVLSEDLLFDSFSKIDVEEFFDETDEEVKMNLTNLLTELDIVVQQGNMSKKDVVTFILALQTTKDKEARVKLIDEMRQFQSQLASSEKQEQIVEEKTMQTVEVLSNETNDGEIIYKDAENFNESTRVFNLGHFIIFMSVILCVIFLLMFVYHRKK